MGLFGGGRKAAERAAEEEKERHHAAIRAEVDAADAGTDRAVEEWLTRVEQHRPDGANRLTNDVLELAGPFPLPRFRPEISNHASALMATSAAKAQGAESARLREARVNPKDDPELSSYWTSVSNFVSGL